ncbi:hypothetical protein [Streptomyces coeruleorubidus]
MRVPGACYPPAAFAVTLATANHIVADAMAGAATLVIGFLLQRLLTAGEGFVVSLVGTGLVVGSGVACTLVGPADLRSGDAGVVCTLTLALYLLIVRAGRVLVGAVVLTGPALAVLVPQVAAEVRLTERGLRHDVIVTAVQTERSPGGRTAPRCSFAWLDGVPVPVAIRRACEADTGVGDRITALFDPRGVLAPRASVLSGSAA